MSTIYRGNHSNLWITLQASEELGILASDYLEDYYGNDGQVSLYHVPTDTHYPMVMIEVAEDTPEIPHDVFRGMHSLASLPDGQYEVRGRVRDIIGNYSIINAVETPLGGERVVLLNFNIKAGHGLVYQVGLGGALVRTGIQGPALQRDVATGVALVRDAVAGSTLERPDLTV